jgi:shikimate 5-dehydrogenase
MTIRDNGEMEKFNSSELLFLGVSTAHSQINKLFDRWARCLGSQLRLELHDMKPGSDAIEYVDFVDNMRSRHPYVLGALITSHKAAVFDFAKHSFDQVTDLSLRLGEIGMVYWRNGHMVGDANDALSTRQVALRILTNSHSWECGSHRAVILGGGGAGVALANTLVSEARLQCNEIIISEVNHDRVEAIRKLISRWESNIPITVCEVSDNSDDIVQRAGPGCLVANATGLGKDRPGSPITESVQLPTGCIVWEFNYRFIPQPMPNFLEIANRQAFPRDLVVEDGTDYFIWGWLGVMANALQLDPLHYHQAFRESAAGLSS